MNFNKRLWLSGIFVLAFLTFLCGFYVLLRASNHCKNFDEDTSYLLLSPNQTPVDTAKIEQWICSHNQEIERKKVHYIVETYVREAQDESINVFVALAQMLLETAYLRFSGSVSAEQNNFAGLGCIHNTHPGEQLHSIEEGIRAHIQHLKSYASKGMLHHPCVDPRRKLVQSGPHFGTVKTVHQLSGTWATDPDYGKKLTQIIDRLRNL